MSCFALAAAGAAGLIRYELRRDEPLIEVRFFRSVPFSGATLIAIFAFAAFGGFLFLNSLYLQDVRGFSALHAGLLLVPMALMMLVLSPLSGRIVGSRGPRLPLLAAGRGLHRERGGLDGAREPSGAGWVIRADDVL